MKDNPSYCLFDKVLFIFHLFVIIMQALYLGRLTMTRYGPLVNWYPHNFWKKRCSPPEFKKITRTLYLGWLTMSRSGPLVNWDPLNYQLLAAFVVNKYFYGSVWNHPYITSAYFWAYSHPPYVSINSTERQQQMPFFRPHPPLPT